MNILIFGASGATGLNLVSQALRDGHTITAFVRDPTRLKIKHKNVRALKGNVLNYHRVDEAVANQDAVVSALGASNPFKRDLNLIKGIQNIVAAMTSRNVRRFIYQSFIGVTENRDELGFLFKVVTPLILHSVISDHEEKERIITTSGLDWTIVRCPLLTNGSFTGGYRDGERIVSSAWFPRISRADVADFMLRQITETKYSLKKPRIMY